MTPASSICDPHYRAPRDYEVARLIQNVTAPHDHHAPANGWSPRFRLNVGMFASLALNEGSVLLHHVMPAHSPAVRGLVRLCSALGLAGLVYVFCNLGNWRGVLSRRERRLLVPIILTTMVIATLATISVFR